MPVSSEETSRADSSGENEAPEMRMLFISSSMVYCLRGRAATAPASLGAVDSEVLRQPARPSMATATAAPKKDRRGVLIWMGAFVEAPRTARNREVKPPP